MDVLSDEEVREFQRHWQEEFGETISADSARTRLRDVVTLFTFLADWSENEATEPLTLTHEVSPLLSKIE